MTDYALSLFCLLASPDASLKQTETTGALVSPWNKPESAENHCGTLRLYLCVCGFLEVHLQTSAGVKLTGTPEEIPTGQANRGPGPGPKQEVPPLALPFQELQWQEALADCAWRLQLVLPESAIEVRCSLLPGLAKQVTQGLVCSGSRRELPPIEHNPGSFYHPEDTGTGASLSHYRLSGYAGAFEDGSLLYAGPVLRH